MTGERVQVLVDKPNPKVAEFHLVKYGFRFNALHSFRHYKNLYKLWVCWTIVICFMVLPVLYIGALFTMPLEFVSDYLCVVQVAINSITGPIRMVFMMVHKSRIDKAIALLDKLSERCQTKRQQQQLHNMMAMANRMFWGFFCCYESFIVFKVLSGFINHKPGLNLYMPYQPLFSEGGPLWLQQWTEVVMLQYGAIMEMIVDLFPPLFVLALNEHTKMLGMRIKDLSDGAAGKGKQRYQRLIECVQDYEVLLQYCRLIRPPLSGITLLQFMVCGTTLGICVINMVYFSNFLKNLENFPYVLMVFLQTFPLCYICECLLVANEELSDALFHTDWMYEKPNYKKVLLFFLVNVQQQRLEFNAFIFHINLGTNITFSKFAFTVFTLSKKFNLGGLQDLSD